MHFNAIQDMSNPNNPGKRDQERNPNHPPTGGDELSPLSWRPDSRLDSRTGGYSQYPAIDRLGFPINFDQQLYSSTPGNLLGSNPFNNAAWAAASNDLQPRPFPPNSFRASLSHHHQQQQPPQQQFPQHGIRDDMYQQQGIGNDLFQSQGIRNDLYSHQGFGNDLHFNPLLDTNASLPPREMDQHRRDDHLAGELPNRIVPSAFPASPSMMSPIKSYASTATAQEAKVGLESTTRSKEDQAGQKLIKGMFGSKKAKELLPPDFQPSEYTVILGRGRCTESIGNKRFKAVVQSHLQEYLEAPGKLEKTFIVTKVMNIIRESCPVGAFVKFENGRWWTAGERAAREKVGASFRDALHNYYKSSSKSKVARRKAKEQEWASGGDAPDPTQPQG